MSDQCVGEIRMFAGNYAPDGWALCDGKLLNISGNEVLYSLIGTAYGGDGRTTFALPDLRSRLPLNQGTSLLGTSYVLGAHGGTEGVTLTTHTMPAHVHTPVGTSASATTGNPAQQLMAKTVNSNGGTNQDIMYLKANAPVLGTYTLNGETVTTTGANQAHNNVMPCAAVNFIIATTGFYPDFS